MEFAKYLESLKDEQPPDSIGQVLQSLWWDGKGDWDKAHSIIQDVTDWKGAWVHAYLHRKEGDLWNSDYWYSNAGKTRPDVTLDKEWELLVKYFCKE